MLSETQTRGRRSSQINSQKIDARKILIKCLGACCEQILLNKLSLIKRAVNGNENFSHRFVRFDELSAIPAFLSSRDSKKLGDEQIASC
jgi:hypothetical protein